MTRDKNPPRDLFADLPEQDPTPPEPPELSGPAEPPEPPGKPEAPAPRNKVEPPRDDRLGYPPGASRGEARPGALPDALPAPGNRNAVISVTELNRQIRIAVERPLSQVLVAGELANVKHHGRSGHIYFTLKDRDAQIRGVMFQINTQRLEFRPADGIEVLVRGGVSMYETRGEVQLYAESIEPRGKGASQLAIEQLAARLKQEGLFERSRKRKLPWLPRGVGIVTSLNGAALRDMLKVLKRRFPGLPVVVAAASVQGEAAVREVIRAVRALNRYAADPGNGPPIDVMIVGRGGGSYEDLAAFNDEQVARAIVASALPVVSAVGHETDLTIADLVADRRALSPSEGAELVVPSRAELLDRTRKTGQRLDAAMRRSLRLAQDRASQIGQRLDRHDPARRLREFARQTDTLADRLDAAVQRLLQAQRARVDTAARMLRPHHPLTRLAALREELDDAAARLDRATQLRLQTARDRLPQLAARFDALSPLRVLERGYSVTLDESGHAVIDADQVKPGGRIITRLKNGQLVSRVEAAQPPDAKSPEPRP